MDKNIIDLSYNDAIQKIKQITSDIEQLDGNLDLLVEKVKELKRIIIYCESKVMDAETEIRDIFDEEE